MNATVSARRPDGTYRTLRVRKLQGSPLRVASAFPAIRLNLTNDRVFKFSTRNAVTCAQTLETALRRLNS